MTKHKRGFTLLEVLIAVIIIAVLATVAWPQYKHAVLKSRFSTVMPMAKAVADAQEVYYLGNNQYALGKEDLDIAPVEAENTQVSLSTGDEEDKYIYVAAYRTDIPNVRYIMYQKNSTKFASNIHCEAKADNDDALWLCEKGLQGTEVTGSGSLQGGTYKTFLLAGNQGDSSFLTCPTNATCDEQGTVTGCEEGYYQDEQTTCKQGTMCDKDTEIIRTSCSGNCGEEVKQGTCNFQTGTWNYTVTQSCPVKPSNYTEPCADGSYGTQRYTYVCNDEGTAWVAQLSSSSCPVEGTYGDGTSCSSSESSNKCSGYTFSYANCSTYNSSESGCNGNTYTKGSICFSFIANSCNGGTYSGRYTFESSGWRPSYCQANSGAESSCNGATFNEYGQCNASASNSCNNGTFNSGSMCVASASNTCSGTYNGTAYCSGSYCPAGSPVQYTNGKTCWDGNGNKGAQYCNGGVTY